MVFVDTAAFRAGLAPTPNDLQAFYAQNKQRYTVPEQRVLRIAAIGPEQVASVVPSDAEIAAYYTANRATYGGRETRVLTQAVVPTSSCRPIARGSLPSFAAATAPAGSRQDISVGPQTLPRQFVALAGEPFAPGLPPPHSVVVPILQSDLAGISCGSTRPQRSRRSCRCGPRSPRHDHRTRKDLCRLVARSRQRFGAGPSIVRGRGAIA